MPGGGLHRGEDSLVGALRELKEETGLTPKPTDLQPLGKFDYHHNQFKYQFYLFIVELDTRPDIKKRPTEIMAAAWASRGELADYFLAQDVVQAVEQWPAKK